MIVTGIHWLAIQKFWFIYICLNLTILVDILLLLGKYLTSVLRNLIWHYITYSNLLLGVLLWPCTIHIN